MTDIHIQPERGAAKGFAEALRHAQSLTDPVQLVLTGGDLIMDSFEANAVRTTLQWALWQTVCKEECSAPIEHCLGNHDIWGWNKARSGTTGDERLWGKTWAREVLGLDGDFHAFERAGWKFLSLDSVRPLGDGYTAFLDEGQLEWLRGELARTPATMPILVVSHIPLLSVTAMCDPRRRDGNAVNVPGNLMHADTGTISDLFAAHPNVKLCLSGHMHLLDRVEWRGCTYICDGAVSGSWWKGPHRGVPEGYGLIDLHDDGTFVWSYQPYGWVAREE